MVPSLRFLPRWWVIASVLLGVSLSLASIAWLAMLASRGGRPLPVDAPNKDRDEDDEDAARAAPRPPAAIRFPDDGCPALGETLRALHFKGVNGSAYALFLGDLFSAYLAMRAEEWHAHGHSHGHGHAAGRPGGGPGGPGGPGDVPGRSGNTNTRLKRHPLQHGRHGRPAPNTTTTMVCYLLVTLLVASAVLAIAEVLRDWWASVAAKSRRARL